MRLADDENGFGALGDYDLDHLAHHISEVGDLELLYQVLASSPDWLRTKLRRLGDPLGIVADFRIGLTKCGNHGLRQNEAIVVRFALLYHSALYLAGFSTSPDRPQEAGLEDDGKQSGFGTVGAYLAYERLLCRLLEACEDRQALPSSVIHLRDHIFQTKCLADQIFYLDTTLELLLNKGQRAAAVGLAEDYFTYLSKKGTSKLREVRTNRGYATIVVEGQSPVRQDLPEVLDRLTVHDRAWLSFLKILERHGMHNQTDRATDHLKSPYAHALAIRHRPLSDSHIEPCDHLDRTRLDCPRMPDSHSEIVSAILKFRSLDPAALRATDRKHVKRLLGLLLDSVSEQFQYCQGHEIGRSWDFDNVICEVLVCNLANTIRELGYAWRSISKDILRELVRIVEKITDSHGEAPFGGMAVCYLEEWWEGRKVASYAYGGEMEEARSSLILACESIGNIRLAARLRDGFLRELSRFRNAFESATRLADAGLPIQALAKIDLYQRTRLLESPAGPNAYHSTPYNASLYKEHAFDAGSAVLLEGIKNLWLMGKRSEVPDLLRFFFRKRNTDSRNSNSLDMTTNECIHCLVRCLEITLSESAACGDDFDRYYEATLGRWFNLNDDCWHELAKSFAKLDDGQRCGLCLARIQDPKLHARSLACVASIAPDNSHLAVLVAEWLTHNVDRSNTALDLVDYDLAFRTLSKHLSQMSSVSSALGFLEHAIELEERNERYNTVVFFATAAADILSEAHEDIVLINDLLQRAIQAAAHSFPRWHSIPSYSIIAYSAKHCDMPDMAMEACQNLINEFALRYEMGAGHGYALSVAQVLVKCGYLDQGIGVLSTLGEDSRYREMLSESLLKFIGTLSEEKNFVLAENFLLLVQEPYMIVSGLLTIARGYLEADERLRAAHCLGLAIRAYGQIKDFDHRQDAALDILAYFVYCGDLQSAELWETRLDSMTVEVAAANLIAAQLLKMDSYCLAFLKMRPESCAELLSFVTSSQPCEGECQESLCLESVSQIFEVGSWFEQAWSVFRADLKISSSALNSVRHRY